jgi:hypothetical protein
MHGGHAIGQQLTPELIKADFTIDLNELRCWLLGSVGGIASFLRLPISESKALLDYMVAMGCYQVQFTQARTGFS